MKRPLILCVLFLIWLATIDLTKTVIAHGGGIDSYGCHRDNQQGGYHCHSGPLAGRAFSSQTEMLSELQSEGHVA